ncbi:MAG: ubiquinone/menaquinone biosynthesis methyltransferase [Verrucomicrobiales bacterium]
MQDPAFVHQAFSEIADRYVATNHILSLGIDMLWRRRVAALVAADQPWRVLDVATGSGDLAEAIGRACPAARVTGSDFCEPMLEYARRRGIDDLVVADALAMPFADGEFDALTVAFGLRNMASWDGALREMRRVLRPGGLLAVLDFSLPEGPLRGAYRFYLHHVLPKIAGFVTRRRGAYEYLSNSIEEFPSGRAMCQLIARSGFADPRHLPLTGGIASIYLARA